MTHASAGAAPRPHRPPALHHRRDGILPAVAAALSVRGETLTCTAGKGDQPPALHPLVQDFLDTLTSGQRERFTGRCPEAILLSRHLTAAETAPLQARPSANPSPTAKPAAPSNTPSSPPAASARTATRCTAATHRPAAPARRCSPTSAYAPSTPTDDREKG